MKDNADKISVLVVTPFFSYEGFEEFWKPRYDPQGGMHLLISRLCFNLAEKNVFQIVTTMGLPGMPKSWTPVKNVLAHKVRIPIIPIPSPLEGYYGLVKSWGLGTLIWVIMNRKRIRVDLVHGHCDGSGTALFTCYAASKLLKVPLVIHIHSSRLNTQTATTFTERFTDPLAKSMEMRAAREAEKVIVLNERLKNCYIDKAKVDPSKINCLPSLAEPDFRSLDTREKRNLLRKQYNIPEDKKIVLYLGRISAEKGCHHILELARLLPSSEFHVIFCGDGPLRDDIGQLSHKMGVRDMVTFTGFIDHKYVPSMITLSDIGVVPSLYEELGLIILEFMMMKLPVIVHNVDGISELVKNNETGIIVEPGDYKAMVSAINNIVENSELSDKLVNAAFEEVRSKKSLSDVATAIYDLYLDVTGN